MKKYTIEITETLQKQIVIKAHSKEEAIQKIKEQYRNTDIVLDSEDYIDTQIQCVHEEKVKNKLER